MLLDAFVHSSRLFLIVAALAARMGFIFKYFWLRIRDGFDVLPFQKF